MAFTKFGFMPTPPDFSLSAMLESSAFVEDAQNFAAIPDEVFEKAMVALESASGFVGRQRVSEVMLGEVSVSDQANSLARFVVNFGELRRDMDEEAEDFARIVIANLPEAIGETEREVFAQRLPRVVGPKEGLERQAKAEQLVRRTGAHVHDLGLVCDLRSVFDETGEKIDGLIPMTTLRMVLHHYGKMESVEVRLSEKQLHRLCSDAERAKRKIHALKAFVNSSGVSLPDTSATVTGEEV